LVTTFKRIENNFASNKIRQNKSKLAPDPDKSGPHGRKQEASMFKSILVPIDLADTDLAKPAIATAATLSQTWHGTVRLLNVQPMTPAMLAEYVPADFDVLQRGASEEALSIVAKESGIAATRITTAVRQGGIYHEILEEAAAIQADLIVMTSHRPAMKTYFLGSNAGHVVRYAPCSVLVVRH
jgi:nucleotide-binding universal stress UspA family protein